MATMIPALGACVSRMTAGERRLAERLEQKLDADYLLWYDVPVGPRQAHPDFVVLHPGRGLLVLETKDWKLETIARAGRGEWQIRPDGVPKTVANPLEQARQYAHQVVDALKRDPQLVQHEGKWQGMLTFPWSYGVVLTHITRKQFDDAGLDGAIDGHRVVCRDEMTESVEPEDLQSRLWGMFPMLMRGALSLPQLDRVRWNLFPEVRITTQAALFDDADETAEVPGLLRVMDLQQEQLARSLGDGHRVIHGVAGSGKTMILGYRAEYLARAATPATKPVLVLCFNEPLAVMLNAHFVRKELDGRVHVRHFHRWCHQQLVAFGQELPDQRLGRDGVMHDMVLRVITGVERGHIPAGQYQAVLIDEGHDFPPEWLKLVTQMVDPETNSLLLLYDDAQNIYEQKRNKAGRSSRFSFRSVGIQAQGRTTVLKINYRNTRQILQTASLVAADLLKAPPVDEAREKPDGPVAEDGDGAIPLLQPISCGRDGHPPKIIRLPTLREEAYKIADILTAAHQEGHAWSDMAILGRRHAVLEECAAALHQRRLPHQVRRRPGDFDPGANTIKLLTMHASKGLEFPVVALAGVGEMPGAKEDEREEARLFYVAATRATQKLVVGVSGDGGFAARPAWREFLAQS